MITGIVYVSQATTPFDDDELLALANQSAEKNQRLSVTGYLYYANGQFMQYIEGERNVTLELMERIRVDERHRIDLELVDHSVPSRRFYAWNLRWLKRQDMRFLHLEHTVGDYIRSQSAFQHSVDWTTGVWKLIDQLAKAHRDMLIKTGPIVAGNFNAGAM